MLKRKPHHKGFKKPDYKAALEKRLEKRKRDEIKLAQQPVKRRNGLKSAPDPKLIAWSKKVRERDGHQCQWPGIRDYMETAPEDFKIPIKLAIAPCATGDARIDAHHKMKRSQRPDQKYNVDCGVALCRTHHQWTDDNQRRSGDDEIVRFRVL